MILFNDPQFAGAMNQLRQAVEDLSTRNEATEITVSQRAAVIEYWNRLQQIARLMELYKRLLEKDGQAIAQVRQNMLGQDQRLGGIFSARTNRTGGQFP